MNFYSMNQSVQFASTNLIKRSLHTPTDELEDGISKEEHWICLRTVRTLDDQIEHLFLRQKFN